MANLINKIDKELKRQKEEEYEQEISRIIEKDAFTQTKRIKLMWLCLLFSSKHLMKALQYL
jgi:hypothetical protein